MPPNGRIDQAGGAGSGVSGNAREGLWLSTAINLVDVGSGSPSSRLWTLVDRPPGSAAALINATTATATVTPDVPGSYLFQLKWNGDDNQIFERVFRVTLDAAGAALKLLPPLPAAGEERHHSNGIVGQGVSGRGWSPLMDALRKRAGLQLLAFNASLTIDLSQGQTVRVTALTNNITINNPTLPADGEQVSIETVQDGTGGRAITWGGVFQFADGLGYNDRRLNIRTIHRFQYNADLNKLVCIERVLDPRGEGIVEFSAPGTLVPGLVNVLRAGANAMSLPNLSTGWTGARNAITVKHDNLTTPPCVITPTGGATVNGGATYNVTGAYGQAVVVAPGFTTSGTILVSPG